MTETKKLRMIEERKHWYGEIMKCVNKYCMSCVWHSEYHCTIENELDIWTTGKYWFKGTGATGVIRDADHIAELINY